MLILLVTYYYYLRRGGQDPSLPQLLKVRLGSEHERETETERVKEGN